MCELFGMAARHPATISLSLAELARHGGLTDRHRDGWGVAWYDGLSASVLREAAPASDSELVRLLLSDALESRIVIAHIRHATQGPVSLCNTQPFVRRLGGRDHVFAHNGDLRGLADQPRHRPDGDTDSERAFCLLLDRLAPLWRGDAPPPREARLEVFAAFARDMARHGPANFLYSDGELLYAHGHRRTQPGGGIEPPGLHLLERSCQQPAAHAFAGMLIGSRTVDQHVRLVASVPLSPEPWQPLPEGAVLALEG